MSEVKTGVTTEAAILERVAKLEGRLDTEQQSLTKQFAQWTALLALIISIAVGGFQVYENVVIREREYIAADRETLADYVEQLTDLNSRLVSASFSGVDTIRLDALAKTFNIEKISILGLADSLLAQRMEIASYASLVVLSREHLSWGNTERAREYAETALSLATTDMERVEAMRNQAGILFALGDDNIERSRTIFGSAIQTIENMEFVGRASLFSNVYLDWIRLEVALGDCSVAAGAWENFAEAIQKENNGIQMWQTMESQISATVPGIERCQRFLN